MYKYYKKRYALSEQGAKNLRNATWRSFLTYVVNLAPIFLLMLLTDQLILNNHHTKETYVILAIATILIMYYLLSKEYVSLYNTTYQESETLRINIGEILAKLPLSYFSTHNLADLSETIMSDVERIEHAMSHSIPKVIGLLLFFPVMGIMLLMGNFTLGLSVIIPTILSFIFIPLAKNRQIKENTKYYQILRENANLFQETIELQKEINSFNLTQDIKNKLYKKMETSENIHFKVESGSVFILGLSTLFAFLSLPLVIFVGINLLLKNEITLLYLLGYIIATMKIKELFDILKEGILEMFYIEPAVQRIRDIKETKLQSGVDTEFSNYDIQFQNVGFSYKEDTKILENITFKAKQNEVTAIVSASGGGKTTILKLISRLYDRDTGTILLGNKDLNNISTQSLFKNISIVFQDVTLFNTTILENIRLGRQNASDEEVQQAAKLANCLDFIEKLPQGIQTQIGENGANLSGGERQRISIARAFLKNAPILILDEIASSIDIDNEKKIQDSLTKLIQNKTVIIISHRLKAIEKANKIIVLANGNVENIGTHRELLEKSKTYQNLVNKSKLAEGFSY